MQTRKRFVMPVESFTTSKSKLLTDRTRRKQTNHNSVKKRSIEVDVENMAVEPLTLEQRLLQTAKALIKSGRRPQITSTIRKQIHRIDINKIQDDQTN